MRHVVLTVRRVPLGELRDSLKRIRLAFRRLRRQLPAAFRSGVYSIETKGTRPNERDRKPGGWHPHVHALTTGDYLAQQELALRWEEATGGEVCWEAYRAFVKAHGGPGRDASLAELRGYYRRLREACVVLDGWGRIVWIDAVKTPDVDGLERGMREALKYATKGNEEAAAAWDSSMAREWSEATKHARLYQTFGGARLEEEHDAGCHCDACGGELVLVDQGSAVGRASAEAWLRAEPIVLGGALDGVRIEWDPTLGAFRCNGPP